MQVAKSLGQLLVLGVVGMALTDVTISSGETFKPVCVCKGCPDNSIVRSEHDAALLGEAYLRVIFGDDELVATKPVVGYRHKRSSGDYWTMFGKTRSPKSGLYNTVFIDEKTGCLLFAYGAH